MSLDVRAFVPGMFGIQAIVSATLILFSMIQLGCGKPVEVYLPVLTGTAAYWLPNPKTVDARKAERDKDATTALLASHMERKAASAAAKAQKTDALLASVQTLVAAAPGAAAAATPSGWVKAAKPTAPGPHQV